MAYRCEQAITGGATEAIRCKVSGTVCAHQKFCGMEGRIVLTDGALRCPARDGKLPEAACAARDGRKEARRTAVKKPAAAAKKTTARKARKGE